jgi:diguanylate cyclase (GGDEF)-like protein
MRNVVRNLDTSVSFNLGLLERMPAATLLVGLDGIVQAANASARQLLDPIEPVGLSLATAFGLAGGNSADLVPRTSASHRLRVPFSDGRIIDVQVTAPDADGSVVTAFDVSTYVKDAELGSKDMLTGLYNRPAFLARLQEALADAERSQASVAVLCLAHDRFKNVNDTLGHPIGDMLLSKVADRLRSAARKGDIIGRLGGDEFAILQRGADQPLAAQALAARFVDLVGRTYVLSGHSIHIGASVGIALSAADADADVLMKRADLAMYRAKASGRGQFSFFEPEMDAQMQRRRALELDLRRALALKQFELAFQPQFSVDGQALVGFEALLRWQSPTRGFVSPADFIPLAEEIGLMIPIGEWVLRTACKQAASWEQPLTIAVNLSALQFQSNKLVETVASALAHAQLPAERLELEITESALLDDTDVVLQALRAIKALGVRISMDDFGTGYSSLSYLQKFPFHKIKIDQSFVRRMEQDAESKAIVRAIAALGASLGMTTTAEGVETAEQLDLVRAEGCTHVQGYLTGRPMPSAQAAALAAVPQKIIIAGDAT